MSSSEITTLCVVSIAVQYRNRSESKWITDNLALPGSSECDEYLHPMCNFLLGAMVAVAVTVAVLGLVLGLMVSVIPWKTSQLPYLVE